MVFAAGLSYRYLFGAALLALPALYVILMSADYRRQRLLAFLNPWADPLGNGFDWGDGHLWGGGSGVIGDTIVRPTAPAIAARGGSLGWARAVMLEFLPEDYTKALAWAVDAVVLKYNTRRFTT